MISAIVMTNSICLSHIPNMPSEFTDISVLTYNWIWLTFTNDTYANLMSAVVSTNLVYVISFFVGSYITQKFLLSLLLGATFDMFTELSKKQLTSENKKAMQGMVKAFSAMDVQHEGKLSRFMFGKCLHYYQPQFTNEDIALYYELISGGSQTISLLQFLQLKYVLSFHFIKHKAVDMGVEEVEVEVEAPVVDTRFEPTPLETPPHDSHGSHDSNTNDSRSRSRSRASSSAGMPRKRYSATINAAICKIDSSPKNSGNNSARDNTSGSGNGKKCIDKFSPGGKDQHSNPDSNIPVHSYSLRD